MFGFQLFDEEEKPFWDESILQARIMTYTKQWNEETQEYRTFRSTMNIDTCSEVFQPEDEKWAERFDIDWNYLSATGFD